MLLLNFCDGQRWWLKSSMKESHCTAIFQKLPLLNQCVFLWSERCSAHLWVFHCFGFRVLPQNHSSTGTKEIQDLYEFALPCPQGRMKPKQTHSRENNWCPCDRIYQQLLYLWVLAVRLLHYAGCWARRFHWFRRLFWSKTVCWDAQLHCFLILLRCFCSENHTSYKFS